VERFLEQVRRQIAEAFHELRGISSENLMYIKEDLIIPHHYSFYDLIVSKARGKSGPLFHFDVRDDVRINTDVRVEKDESHAGKIITRSYYERNQHIFPVNRWEVYDPNKSWEQYTVKDRPDIK
jgi:protein FAM50